MLIRPIKPPLLRPMIDPILAQGGGLPWDQASGGGAGILYSSPNVYAAWLPRLATPGTVTSWADIRAGFVFTNDTGTTTASQTSFNGHPGVASSGSSRLKCTTLGATLSGLSRVVVTCACVDTITATAVLWEYISAANFSLIVNDTGGAGHLEALASATVWQHVTESLASPCVLSAGYDKSIEGGITFIRKNQVALSLTEQGSGIPGGTLASGNLFLFDRGTGGLPETATIGPFVIHKATGAELIAIEQAVAAECGL